VRDAIFDGRLRPGSPLPPSRDLARQLKVSRTTVVVAYDRLISEGYVETRARSGTFVTSNVAARRRTRPSGDALRPRHRWEYPTFVRDWPDARFDFRTGIPDATLFPFELWRRHLAAAGLHDRELRRGVYGAPAGHWGLRVAIARHLGVARAIHASPDDIIITNGAQQAIDLIARVMLEPRDRVAVEDPGYGPPRRLFESLRGHVSGVPVDEQGIVVDRIPAGTRIVYVTPAHQ
jgi:GntR family transcriptional regulator/MocR family aminotransferase